ncbi:MAG: GNAT family N-acetyltransferase [Oscillibacter sp.]|nr:GNAT family N-acetyltransferase [Oscillibacter sp.]
MALDFASREKKPGEELWVAEAEGKLIGCIMLCQSDEPLTGQLRLFLVEKAYRQFGVGTALTQALLQKAR